MWKTPDEACVDEVGDWVVGVVRVGSYAGAARSREGTLGRGF
jgi:hypothetical protein